MHIKICGITNMEDALHAVQSGASHLGLIFVEKSPRCVAPEEAARIVAGVKSRALTVGVFQNHDVEEISKIVKETGIDLVQLHGEETPAFCKQLRKALDKPVIKTIILGEGALPTNCEANRGEASLNTANLESYLDRDSQNSFLLFDRAKGASSDRWLSDALSLLAAMDRESANPPPYFFAGGLSPDNLQLVLEKINPAGLDVASGVEASPGKKDPAKVSKFISTAKNYKAPRVC
jgi:phosphoribosylanthranilate isomerase